ncbi:hypothetical protein [Actinoallomurus sp. NPDC050550]|uniref:hypothetical protein n=1 Tax=Actinoallomurus sp. NPDC050550 TaxID=3154937 RepID=UPI0033D98467
MTYPDGDLENSSPESFSISRELADSLNEWAGEYDAILNEDDPVSSGFATPEDEQSFNERGRTLAERFAQEVGPKYKVAYYDMLESKDIPVGAQE